MILFESSWTSPLKWSTADDVVVSIITLGAVETVGLLVSYSIVLGILFGSATAAVSTTSDGSVHGPKYRLIIIGLTLDKQVSYV